MSPSLCLVVGACAAVPLAVGSAAAAAAPTVLWPGSAGSARIPIVAGSRSGTAVGGWTVGLGMPGANPVVAMRIGGSWGGAVSVPGPRPAWVGGLGVDRTGGVTVLLSVVPGLPLVGLTAVTRAPDGSWGAAEEIVHPSRDSLPRAARLVENGRGDAVVVWEQWGRRSIIRASVRPAGGRWSAPADLEPRPAPAHEGGPEPQVVIDPAGAIVAVWERDGTVFAARGTASGTWSAPESITGGQRPVFGPRIGLVGPGRPVVVWGTTEPNIAQGVKAAVGAPGGGWTPERLPVVARGAGGGSPMLAAAPSGRAAVVWGRDVAQRRTLLVTTRRPDGRWRAPLALIAGVPLPYALEPPNVVVRVDGGTTVGYRLGGRSVVAEIAPDGTLAFQRTVGAGGAGVPFVATVGPGAIAVWGRHGVVRALPIPAR